MKEIKKSKSAGVAQNTVLLYLRMIIVMLINLYAVRVVLKALGTEDYGIYNVVAGVVTLMSCVSSVLSMATQRYYSFAMGENRHADIKYIFSASLNIYIVLSIVVVILGETLGLWFFNTNLIIPESKLASAHIVYQASIISFIVTLIQVPYSAAVIAFEHMGKYAMISTIDCLLKFLSALILFIIPYDRLMIYGIALLVGQLIILTLYLCVCKKNYDVCCYTLSNNRKFYHILLSFSGWTLFGSIANVGMMQVNTILLNMFFGPCINAARAISLQVYNAITAFCNCFIMALRPPMIKSYAEGDYTYLFKVFELSNKIIYYCFVIISVPMYLEMDTILNIWLTEVTPETIVFSRLILIYTVLVSLHNPITILIQATGNVKDYYVPVEIFTILSVPVTYILFKYGFSAETSAIIMILAALCSHIVRIVCLKRQIPKFSVSNYTFKFILPAFFITTVVFFICNVFHNNYHEPYKRLFFITIESVAITPVLVYLTGLTFPEREFLKYMVKSLMKILK